MRLHVLSLFIIPLLLSMQPIVFMLFALLWCPTLVDKIKVILLVYILMKLGLFVQSTWLTNQRLSLHEGFMIPLVSKQKWLKYVINI